MDIQVVKAVVRRMLQVDLESAFAAERDAGFDGGEWSGPAHSDMLHEQHSAMLGRLTDEEKELAESYYTACHNLDAEELHHWWQERTKKYQYQNLASFLARQAEMHRTF